MPIFKTDQRKDKGDKKAERGDKKFEKDSRRNLKQVFQNVYTKQLVVSAYRGRVR